MEEHEGMANGKKTQHLLCTSGIVYPPNSRGMFYLFIF